MDAGQLMVIAIVTAMLASCPAVNARGIPVKNPQHKMESLEPRDYAMLKLLNTIAFALSIGVFVLIIIVNVLPRKQRLWKIVRVMSILALTGIVGSIVIIRWSIA